MKKYKILSFLCVFEIITLLVSPFYTNPQAADRRLEIKRKVEEMTSEEKEFLLNQFIVRFKDSTSESERNNAILENGGISVTNGKTRESGYKSTILMVSKTLKSLSSETKPDPKLLFEESTKGRDGKKDQDLEKLQALRDTLLAFNLDPRVEYAQPNYIYKTTVWTRPDTGDSPADFDAAPSYATGDHWYYEKGKVRQMWQDQDCYNSGTDCGGSNSVVVAVIDTGLAYENRTSNYDEGWTEEPNITFSQASEYNPSGTFNLYTNSGETNCTDGIDNDDNDYIDDCNGYNAYEDYWCGFWESCNASEYSEAGHPNDDYGHGTFVTGSIASNVDNGASSVSPAFNVTIMPIKASERLNHNLTYYYYDNPNPSFYTETICSGIYYAINSNVVDIINMSLGGGAYDQNLEACINDAYNAGIVIVAASGNGGWDGIGDPIVEYPAAYSNVIAVGASNNLDQKASYSNYGSNLDLVAAVGDGAEQSGNRAYQQSIIPFTVDGGYGTCSGGTSKNPYDCEVYDGYTWTYASYAGQDKYALGTSFASPQVAAAAALLKSRLPSLSPQDVGRILRFTATDIGYSEWDSYTGYGIVNFENIWNYSGDINRKLYMAVRGTDDGIYTRAYNGSSWESWYKDPTGVTYGNIGLSHFGDKLYMAVSGSDYGIYTRAYNGSSWESWYKDPTGVTYGDVSITEYNDKLYMAVRGTDDGVYTRSYNGSTWDNWYKDPTGVTYSDVSITSYNGNLYMAVRGTDDGIYTRAYNGSSWGSWYKDPTGVTYGDVSITEYDGKLYMAVRGTDDGIYTRSYNGSTWDNWYKDPTGVTYRNVLIDRYETKFYMAVSGSDDGIYTRAYNGSSWESWYRDPTGVTYGDVSIARYYK